MEAVGIKYAGCFEGESTRPVSVINRLVHTRCAWDFAYQVNISIKCDHVYAHVHAVYPTNEQQTGTRESNHFLVYRLPAKDFRSIIVVHVRACVCEGGGSGGMRAGAQEAPRAPRIDAIGIRISTGPGAQALARRGKPPLL